MQTHATLMQCAANPTDPTVLALAGVLSTALERQGAHALPIQGLNASATRRLFVRWFPGADVALGIAWEERLDARYDERNNSKQDDIDEVDDLVALFTEHADPGAGTAEEIDCVAHALAAACLGDNHLWQDLRLPSRRELSALIGRWFPRLAAKNTHDMKWKKFFYKQLCEREDIFICKAPSCGVCADYAHCFGPE